MKNTKKSQNFQNYPCNIYFKLFGMSNVSNINWNIVLQIGNQVYLLLYIQDTHKGTRMQKIEVEIQKKKWFSLMHSGHQTWSCSSISSWGWWRWLLQLQCRGMELWDGANHTKSCSWGWSRRLLQLATSIFQGGRNRRRLRLGVARGTLQLRIRKKWCLVDVLLPLCLDY